jgi:RNA polymerase sigma-B factor
MAELDDDSSLEEEQRLFGDFARDPSEQALERIILRYERLVYYIVQKYASYGESYDDLVQVGKLGLIQAIRRFKPAKKFRFTTFAYQTVRGEIQRYFRDKKWTMSVPRRLKEISFKVFKAQDDLAKKLRHAPTADEVAAEIGASAETVLEVLELGSAYHPASFFDNLPEEEEGDIGFDGSRSAARPATTDREIFFENLFRHLTPQEATVLKLRFMEGQTQREVAEVLKVSQMYVSRLQRSALDKLRGILLVEDVEAEDLI